MDWGMLNMRRYSTSLRIKEMRLNQNVTLLFTYSIGSISMQKWMC